ncbi:hypothetical protein SAMN05216599_110124 [Pseudomonas cichorii]|nr:hypothetical protein SAMN05216599_110124 [Pseudomonas cichorii]
MFPESKHRLFKYDIAVKRKRTSRFFRFDCFHNDRYEMFDSVCAAGIKAFRNERYEI